MTVVYKVVQATLIGMSRVEMYSCLTSDETFRLTYRPLEIVRPRIKSFLYAFKDIQSALDYTEGYLKPGPSTLQVWKAQAATVSAEPFSSHLPNYYDFWKEDWYSKGLVAFPYVVPDPRGSVWCSEIRLLEMVAGMRPYKISSKKS